MLIDRSKKVALSSGWSGQVMYLLVPGPFLSLEPSLDV